VQRRNFIGTLGLSVAAAALGGAASAATRATAGPDLPRHGRALVMVDRAGCPYCTAWKREILPGYAAHPTGRSLPLALVPLDGPWPDGLALARAPAITPTFLILQDRIEVARIEGYPGARHFWPEVEALLARPAATVAP